MSEAPNIFFKIIAEDSYSEAFKKIEEKTASFEKTHDKATERVKTNNKKIKASNEKIKSSFDNIKNSISGMVGAFIGIGAMKKGFQDFAYFDKYVQKIQAIQHLSTESTKKIREQILTTSTLTGMSATQLASSGTILATAGVKVEEYGNYLMGASQVLKSAREELNMSDITQFFAVIKQNFPDAEVSDMKDSIVWMLDKVPNISFLELQNSLQRSAPIAKAMGISLKELLATESQQIVNIGGARASTQMASLLKELRAKKDAVAEGFKIDIDFEKPDALINFLNDLSFKFKDVKDEQKKIATIQNVLGTGEVSMTLISYLDDIEKINKLHKELKMDSKGFAENVSKGMDNTAIDNYRKILANIEQIFLNIGNIVNEIAIPDALIKGLEGINFVLETVIELISSIKKGFSGFVFDAFADKKFEKRSEIAMGKIRQEQVQAIPERVEKIKEMMKIQEIKQNFKIENFVSQNQESIKLANQEIKITLDNQGAVPISIRDTDTDNKNAKINIDRRNFFNK